VTLYKVLNEDGTVFHSGQGFWPLPSGKRPGKWLSVEGQIVPCHNGLHLCEPAHLVKWLGPAIFEVEVSGEIVNNGDKLVVSRARLVRKTNWTTTSAASFALDCAERALSREKKNGRTPDKRLYDALKVSRRFLKGEATQAEVYSARSAAHSAAYSARSAARSAAHSAEVKWQTKRLMEYVTGKRS